MQFQHVSDCFKLILQVYKMNRQENDKTYFRIAIKEKMQQWQ